MNIFLRKRSFFRETAEKAIVFELWRHQWRNDDAMHLSVNKIILFQLKIS